MPPLDTKCSTAAPVAAVCDRRPRSGNRNDFRPPHLRYPISDPLPRSGLPPSRLRAFAGNPSVLHHPSSALGGFASSRYPISDIRSPGAQRPTRHPLPATRHSRSAAFTLLEVLVASAIMGIVMFVLVSTANTSLQLWRGTSEKIAVDREGRSGMALLAWDLQNILQPANNSLRPKLDTNGNAATPLRFLTLKPADYQGLNSGFGDVCYVEYRFESNALKRGFLSSNATWSHLSAGNMPPTTSIPANQFETLMTNMMQFRVWGYESDGVSITYSGGDQTSFNQILRSIEYRAEVVDQKFMKLYRSSPALAEAQRYQSRKYYQAIQPVPPPAQ